MSKEIEVYRDGHIYARDKKNKGIKGRTSNADIHNRRRCIQDILLEYETITLIDLMNELENNKRKYHFDVPSTESTVRKDLAILNIKTSRKSVRREGVIEITPTMRKLRQMLQNTIRQIRITCGEREHILYSYNTSPDIINIITFKNRIKKIKQDQQKHKLVHLYIIFNNSSQNDEDIIPAIHDYFISNYKYILYTATYNHCIEVVTSLVKIKKLTDALLLILPQYLGIIKK